MPTALRHQLDHRPDFSLLTVDLDAGQQVLAEPGAMAWMDPGIRLKAGMRGGLGKTMGRMLGGESIVQSTYTADAAGRLALVPGGPGDVVHYAMASGRSLVLQRGAWLASGTGVTLTGKWQGARGFFSGEGLVLLKAEGEGDLWFTTFGACLPVEVDGDYLVDTGYVVAFEDTLQYRISALPGLRPTARLKSFFLGGEGLVCRFEGRGRLWIQTRQIGTFLNWVWPYRPAKNND